MATFRLRGGGIREYRATTFTLNALAPHMNALDGRRKRTRSLALPTFAEMAIVLRAPVFDIQQQIRIGTQVDLTLRIDEGLLGLRDRVIRHPRGRGAAKGRHRDKNGRYNARVANRLQHGVERLYVDLAARTEELVALALVPDDIGNLVTPLQAGNRLQHHAVQIRPGLPAGDVCLRDGCSQNDDGLVRAVGNQIIGQRRDELSLRPSRSQQRRRCHKALAVEVVDDAIRVLGHHALRGGIGGVGLADGQDDTRLRGLHRAGDFLLAGARALELCGTRGQATEIVEGVDRFFGSGAGLQAQQQKNSKDKVLQGSGARCNRCYRV